MPKLQFKHIFWCCFIYSEPVLYTKVGGSYYFVGKGREGIRTLVWFYPPNDLANRPLYRLSTLPEYLLTLNSKSLTHSYNDMLLLHGHTMCRSNHFWQVSLLIPTTSRSFCLFLLPESLHPLSHCNFVILYNTLFHYLMITCNLIAPSNLLISLLFLLFQNML